MNTQQTTGRGALQFDTASTERNRLQFVALRADVSKGKAGDGELVPLKGAAAASFALVQFTEGAADSFAFRFESESGKRVEDSQRDEVRAIYRAAGAVAFASCGIVPARRGVLFGYGARRRVVGGVLADMCAPAPLARRIGSRGLLPVVTVERNVTGRGAFGRTPYPVRVSPLLSWRRALRRAATSARSYLNGKRDALSLATGGDEGENLARGMGDGGRATGRGLVLRARGGVAGALSWDRSLGHLVECLRVYWLCGSASGGKGRGASRQWRGGLAADLARIEAMRGTVAGDGLAHWWDESSSLGAAWIGESARAASGTARAGASKLARRIRRGDAVLTDEPGRAGLALAGAGFVPFVGAGIPSSAARCACWTCQGRALATVGVTTVDELGGVVAFETVATFGARSAIFARHGGACEAVTLASVAWRIAPPRTFAAGVSQGRAWCESLTLRARGNVARAFGRADGFGARHWVACDADGAARARAVRLLVNARRCCDAAAAGAGCVCALALIVPEVGAALPTCGRGAVRARQGEGAGRAVNPAAWARLERRRAARAVAMVADAAAGNAAAHAAIAPASDAARHWSQVCAALLRGAESAPAVVEAAARMAKAAKSAKGRDTKKSARTRRAWVALRLTTATATGAGVFYVTTGGTVHAGAYAAREAARADATAAPLAAAAAAVRDARATVRADETARAARQADTARAVALAWRAADSAHAGATLVVGARGADARCEARQAACAAREAARGHGGAGAACFAAARANAGAGGVVPFVVERSGKVGAPVARATVARFHVERAVCALIVALGVL